MKSHSAAIHRRVRLRRNHIALPCLFTSWLLVAGASLAPAVSEDTLSQGTLKSTASASPLRIPRIERAPRIQDFEGMMPNAQWIGKLAVVNGFIQRAPDDGRPATESTEAYLGYDGHALQIVFVAHDREPNKIRARMDHRESLAGD